MSSPASVLRIPSLLPSSKTPCYTISTPQQVTDNLVPQSGEFTPNPWTRRSGRSLLIAFRICAICSGLLLRRTTSGEEEATISNPVYLLVLAKGYTYHPIKSAALVEKDGTPDSQPPSGAMLTRTNKA